jgi:hypothetical protein
MVMCKLGQVGNKQKIIKEFYKSDKKRAIWLRRTAISLDRVQTHKAS